jgi:hypothetical protein
MAGPFQPQQNMFGSVPPVYSPFGGQPDSTAGAIMSMLMPLLQGQMAKFGMVPSQMMPQQNMYDQMMGRQFYDGQQRAMQLGAQRDAKTYEEFFRGTYSAMGFDPKAGKAPKHIETLSSDMASMAPFLAGLMPEDFDAMHGRKGSALVLAQAVHRAGQHQVDPTTGRQRMRGDTAGRLAAEIFDTTYGPGTTLEAMRGVSAGGAGMLYEEMSHRGMLDPSVGLATRDEQLKSIKGMSLEEKDYARIAERIFKENGKTATPAELKQMQADVKTAHRAPETARQELSDQLLTTVDAGKIKGRVQNMTAAVAAMRDIFGDAGNANAPMAELMQALDQLTQGGLANKSPGQLEQLVRKTSYLAKAAGVSMDVVAGLTAQGAGVADRFGLDRSFVPQMLQSSLAFGAASSHQGLFATPAWGASNKEKLTLMHQQLGLSAAASPNANRVNTLLRMVDLGLIDPATAEGKELTKLAEAAKRGDSAAIAGSAVLDDVKFAKLAKGAGVDNYTFQSLLGARDANQEYGNKYNTGKLTTNMQFETDIAPAMQAAFGGQIIGALQNAGIGDSANISNKIGKRVAEGLRNLKPEDRSDPVKRNAAAAKIYEDATRAELTAAGVDATTISSVTDGRAMRAAAEGGWGVFDRSQRKYGRSAEDTLRLYDPRTLAQMGKIEQDAVIDAQTASALAGAGSAGPVRNFVDAIREAGPNEPLEKILYKTIGGTEAKYATEGGKNVTAIASAYMEAQKLLASADNSEAGVKQRQRANAILQGLTSGKITPEQLKELGGTSDVLTRGLEQAARYGGFGNSLREVGIDPNAPPASYLSNKQLMEVMPAAKVHEQLAALAGGPDSKTAKEALSQVFSGGREVQGARAIRSRNELLKLAKDRGLVKDDNLTGAAKVAAERDGIEALLKANDLNADDKETVRRNKHDYSLIQDLGTDAMDSAQEIREKLGARAGERQEVVKLTGTVKMESMDTALLTLMTGGDLNSAAGSPSYQPA